MAHQDDQSNIGASGLNPGQRREESLVENVWAIAFTASGSLKQLKSFQS